MLQKKTKLEAADWAWSAHILLGNWLITMLNYGQLERSSLLKIVYVLYWQNFYRCTLYIFCCKVCAASANHSERNLCNWSKSSVNVKWYYSSSPVCTLRARTNTYRYENLVSKIRHFSIQKNCLNNNGRWKFIQVTYGRLSVWWKIYMFPVIYSRIVN